MAESSLRAKATKGVLWNALEKISIQGGQLIIGIVLARILMPKDFGLIGMLSIFISVSQAFITSGMGAGLIQKTDRTDVDFSTVFVFNFGVSVLFYLILFFSAPFIADFYNTPQLVLLTRVLTINIVVNSLAIVQRSRLTIKLDFKTIAKVNIISVFAGGTTGIVLAYLGFGVWALVAQNLTGAVVSVVLLWFLSKWNPSLKFSKKSFKELFGFGSKLLLSSVYAQAMNNIYNITIGKAFSAAELGYYTRAKGFASLAAGTITNVLQQVAFPVLSSVKDDEKRMVGIYQKMVKMTSYLVFPAMTLLALITDPFIKLVLTEKWIPAIPLLQWMCFARILYPVSAINLNILNAAGRSDLYLKTELFKLPVTVLALIITLPLGVKAMVIGHVVSAFISFFVNTYYSHKLFGYGPFKQLRDMVPSLMATAFTSLVVFMAIVYIDSYLIKIIVGIVSAGVSYFLVSYILKINELEEVKILIQGLVKKNG